MNNNLNTNFQIYSSKRAKKVYNVFINLIELLSQVSKTFKIKA